MTHTYSWHTVIQEILIVTIFSWLAQPTKILTQNIFYKKSRNTPDLVTYIRVYTVNNMMMEAAEFGQVALL